MKIAIASQGKELTSPIDPRFGRCPFFLIIDTETENFEVLENIAKEEFQGAGISTAQLIANKEVGAVIAGNFGPKALSVLKTSGIKIFRETNQSTIENVFERFKEQKLEEITEIPSGFQNPNIS
jgi:predicted Fe-Mo cluster-binding NifX family protein